MAPLVARVTTIERSSRGRAPRRGFNSPWSRHLQAVWLANHVQVTPTCITLADITGDQGSYEDGSALVAGHDDR